MRWLRRRGDGGLAEVRALRFQQCEGCTYDFLTGEGTRRCDWFECPYLPQDLNVFCPECNYNFFTREGTPECGSPPTCDFSLEGWHHAGIARRMRAHSA